MVDTTDAPKIPGVLRKKIGGIPVIAIVAVGVGVLAFVAWRLPSNQVGGAEEVSADTGDDPGEAFGGGLTETGDWTSETPLITNTTPQSQVVADNNNLWSKRAVEWLIAQGSNAGAAQLAISNYINGETLSYDEGELRDKAVKQFGLPPEPITPGNTLEAPARRQGNPPTTHVVKGSHDNSYTELADLYYGSHSDILIDSLQVANPGLGVSGPWVVGTQVKIPGRPSVAYYTTTKTIDTPAEIARKNATTESAIRQFNDQVHWPAKPGTRVRVR